MNSGYASIVDKPAAILQKIEIIVSPTLKGKQVYLRLLQFPQTTCVLDESMFGKICALNFKLVRFNNIS